MSTDDTDPTDYEIEVPGHADGGGRVPDLTPREARDRWLDKLRVDKRESTVSTYHYRTKQFVEWCERERIDTIADVTGWEIESYETHRRSEGLEPLTLKRELETLRLLLEYCARIELVDESLPEKVAPPDVPRSAHVDESKLESDAAEALLEYYRTTPDARHSRGHALLALAWYTGARLGALRGLDLEDVDLEDEFVRFRHRPEEDIPLKNGLDGQRIVGLPSHVCATLGGYLREYRRDVYDEYGRAPLFTTPSGRASKSAVRSWMYLATLPCLHTDCPHGNERETCEFVDYSHASKCPSSRSPHQIRTGSITWQRNRGVPPEVVSERVNSSVRVIEDHYDVPAEREEMEERRRQHLDRLDFDDNGGMNE